MNTNFYRYFREGNDIIAQTIEPNGEINTEPYKVAEIDDNGELQMVKGKAKEHRAGVEDFLERSGELNEPAVPVVNADPGATVDFATVAASPDPVSITAAAIPPCPPENDRDGDKTPEVIAWWFKHKPEEARAKYSGRKFTMPDLS